MTTKPHRRNPLKPLLPHKDCSGESGNVYPTQDETCSSIPLLKRAHTKYDTTRILSLYYKIFSLSILLRTFVRWFLLGYFLKLSIISCTALFSEIKAIYAPFMPSYNDSLSITKYTPPPKYTPFLSFF